MTRCDISWFFWGTLFIANQSVCCIKIKTFPFFTITIVDVKSCAKTIYIFSGCDESRLFYYEWTLSGPKNTIIIIRCFFHKRWDLIAFFACAQKRENSFLNYRCNLQQPGCVFFFWKVGCLIVLLLVDDEQCNRVIIAALTFPSALNLQTSAHHQLTKTICSNASRQDWRWFNFFFLLDEQPIRLTDISARIFFVSSGNTFTVLANLISF